AGWTVRFGVLRSGIAGRAVTASSSGGSTTYGGIETICNSRGWLQSITPGWGSLAVACLWPSPAHPEEAAAERRRPTAPRVRVRRRAEGVLAVIGLHLFWFRGGLSPAHT